METRLCGCMGDLSGDRRQLQPLPMYLLYMVDRLTLCSAPKSAPATASGCPFKAVATVDCGSSASCARPGSADGGSDKRH